MKNINCIDCNDLLQIWGDYGTPVMIKYRFLKTKKGYLCEECAITRCETVGELAEEMNQRVVNINKPWRE